MKKNTIIIGGILLVIGVVWGVIYIMDKDGSNMTEQKSQNIEIPTATTTQSQQNQVQPSQNESGIIRDSYTMVQVASHATVTSCWSVIDGVVYDLTDWVSKHPGGDRAILGICGKDGTVAFTKQHGGKSKPESVLATFKIGTVAR